MHAIAEEAVEVLGAATKLARPNAGEIATVCLHIPKTAALLYDRVWTPKMHEVPDSIRLCGGTTDELTLQVLAFLAETLSRNNDSPAIDWWRSVGRLRYARRIA